MYRNRLCFFFYFRRRLNYAVPGRVGCYRVDLSHNHAAADGPCVFSSACTRRTCTVVLVKRYENMLRCRNYLQFSSAVPRARAHNIIVCERADVRLHFPNIVGFASKIYNHNYRVRKRWKRSNHRTFVFIDASYAVRCTFLGRSRPVISYVHN